MSIEGSTDGFSNRWKSSWRPSGRSGLDVDDAWDLHFPSAEAAGVLSEETIRKRCHELADALDGAEVPLNKNGTPNSGWQKELLRLGGVVRSGDWKAVFALGLGKKIVESGEVVPAGEVTYQRHTPDAYLAPLMDEVVDLARADLARDLTRQAGALERLAKWYREAFEETQKGKGGLPVRRHHPPPEDVHGSGHIGRPLLPAGCPHSTSPPG